MAEASSVRDRGHSRARKAAEQGVRAARRQSVPPGEQVPEDRANERSEHDIRCDDLDIHHAGAYGFRDGGAREEDCGEVEESGHRDSLVGIQDASANDGGNAVGGVVEAVDEIKDESREDDDYDEGE